MPPIGEPPVLHPDADPLARLRLLQQYLAAHQAVTQAGSPSPGIAVGPQFAEGAVGENAQLGWGTAQPFDYAAQRQRAAVARRLAPPARRGMGDFSAQQPQFAPHSLGVLPGQPAFGRGPASPWPGHPRQTLPARPQNFFPGRKGVFW